VGSTVFGSSIADVETSFYFERCHLLATLREIASGRGLWSAPQMDCGVVFIDVAGLVRILIPGFFLNSGPERNIVAARNSGDFAIVLVSEQRRLRAASNVL